MHILFLNSDGTASSTVKISDGENGGPTGLESSDLFGSALTNLGDLNGDGIPDLAVGAFGDEATSGGDGNEGAVHILFLNSELGTELTATPAVSVAGSFTNRGALTAGDLLVAGGATNATSGAAILTGDAVNFGGVFLNQGMFTSDVLALAGDFTNRTGTYAVGSTTLLGTSQQTLQFATTTQSLFADFEAETFPPSGWQTGGNADWTRSTTTTSAGSLGAAASGVITDGETSWLQATTTVSATSSLQFDWQVSSEGNFDFLVLCINQATCTSGSNDLAISGAVDWSAVELTLSPARTSSVLPTSRMDRPQTGRIRDGWIMYPLLLGILASKISPSPTQAATVPPPSQLFSSNHHIPPAPLPCSLPLRRRSQRAPPAPSKM